MKKCQKCGSECEDSAIICPSCGNLFSSQQPGAQQRDAEPNPGQNAAQGEPVYSPYQAPVVAPKNNGLAIASLVCSLVGALCCGLASIAGIILGFIARSQIRQSNGMQQGDGMALAGIIVGIVAIALSIIGGILAAVFIPEFFTQFQNMMNNPNFPSGY